MGILENVKHDVFVSYAHTDNIPDREGERGWVERFERQLSVQLLKRFGRDVDVWRDPELERAQKFDQVIERVARGSGMMIALISAPYMNSEYCGQELDWFQESASDDGFGLVVSDYLRIFPVLLYNIPHQEWPAHVQGTSGHMFHDAENEEYGRPLDPGSDAFAERLEGLVEEIYGLLTKMRAGSDRPRPGVVREASPSSDNGSAAEAKDGEKFKVFLASCSRDEMGSKARQIKRELEDEDDVEVITNVPPPEDEEEHAAHVEEIVKSVDLTVHLVSESPGEKIDERDPEKTYPREQLRIALEHATSQLILMPEEMRIAQIGDESYRRVLEDLTTRPRDASRLELVQINRNRMFEEILNKKEKLQRAIQAATASAEGTTAFVDLHAQDVAHATDLITYLAEQEVDMTMVPSSDREPQMTKFAKNLLESEVFIIVFGSIDREWVEERLRAAQHLMLEHRLRTRVGVYVAPPQKAEDDVVFSPYNVADNASGFDPKTLAPLLS